MVEKIKQKIDNMENCSSNIKIDHEKSIIIVSDLHLGYKNEDDGGEIEKNGEENRDFKKKYRGKTSQDFSSFLEWLKICCDENNEIKIKTKSPLSDKKIKPPQMLILLGDILELWRPRPPLREGLFTDLFPLLSKLLDLPIPIVYVIGNHDREIYGIKGNYSLPSEIEKKIIIEPDQFPYGKISDQEINLKGLKLGTKYEYTFLHGHQFDKSFQFVRWLSEYPGWVCNNTHIFESHPWARRISWFFFFFGLLYFILLALNLLSILPSFVHIIVLFMLGVSLPLFIISIPPKYISSFYNFLSSSLIINKILNIIRKHSPSGKFKRIDYFKAVRKFKRNRTDDGTNIVIFGHTHMADDYINDVSKKRFINSGSWTHEEPSFLAHKNKLRYHIVGVDKDSHKESDYFKREYVQNTFIYLDKEGPQLFVWDTMDLENPMVRSLEIKHL